SSSSQPSLSISASLTRISYRSSLVSLGQFPQNLGFAHGRNLTGRPDIVRIKFDSPTTFSVSKGRFNDSTIQRLAKRYVKGSRRDPVCSPHVVTFSRSRSTSGVSRSRFPCLLCSSRLAKISPLFGRRLTLSL